MAETMASLNKGDLEVYSTDVRFPDYSRLITTVDANWSSQGVNYTATEDCWVRCAFYFSARTYNVLYVDGVAVFETTIRYDPTTGTNDAEHDIFIPVKKGSVLTSRTGSTTTNAILSVYAML